MKIKYRQRKPKAMEDWMKRQGIRSAPVMDLKKCPNCGNMYDSNCHKKVCLKCFTLLPVKGKK